MKILLISYSIYEYDGRLRELVEISQLMGDTYFITRSATGRTVSKNHIIYNGNNKYASFIAYCVKKASALGKFDIVWADNRKGILPAYLIAKKNKETKLIQDARELYVLKETKHISGKIGCLVEILLNRYFDLILCANKERADIMKEMYKLKHDPIVFENLRRLDDVELAETDECTIKQISEFYSGHRWKLISTAGCDLKRGTLQLVDKARELGDEYGLVLVGKSDSNSENTIKTFIKENKINNVDIIGQVLPATLKRIIDMSDVGLVIYNDQDTNNKYCASGKIYEFIYEGKPVVCSNNPPLVALCNDRKFGLAGKDFSTLIQNVCVNYDTFKKSIETFTASHQPEQYREEIKEIVMRKIL